MPANKPDLSLKLKEKLKVYNCFSVAKKQRYIGSVEIAQTVYRITTCYIHVQLHACQDSNEVPCPATTGLTDICVAPTKHTCVHTPNSICSAPQYQETPCVTHVWQQSSAMFNKLMFSFQNAVLCMAPHLSGLHEAQKTAPSAFPPNIGGSQWEALSLTHAADRQA
eukprot:1137310-Pelagomonas_calceolata.AAC.1